MQSSGLNSADAPRIQLLVDKARLPGVSELLAAGFFLSAKGGESARQLLVHGLGLDPDYVEAGIQTVFVNGRPVDDLDRTVLPQDAVLALSSAMPGLVGAVLRRESPLGSMRGEKPDPAPRQALSRAESGGGRVTVKLFNRVAEDLGPPLLAAGLRFPAVRAARFLASQREGAIREARVDGREVQAAALVEMLENAAGDVVLALRRHAEPGA
jgi:hypothetical protein